MRIPGLRHIPNALCILRMPVIFLGMDRIWANHRAEGTWSLGWIALVVAAALTDRLDGFLAKRYGWTSRLGMYLDHISDKVVTLTLFAFLSGMVGFPLWVLGALLFREWFVTGLRTVGNRLRIKVSTSQAGRVKTFYQQLGALFVFWAFVDESGPLGMSWGQWIVWAGWLLLWGAVLALPSWRAKLKARFLIEWDGGVSRIDLYTMLVAFLGLAVPVRFSGLVLVAFVTLATGLSYVLGFLRATRPRPVRLVLVVLGLCAAVLTFLPLWILRHWDLRPNVVGAVVAGVSLLWLVALVVNYRTSRWMENDGKEASTPATPPAAVDGPGMPGALAEDQHPTSRQSAPPKRHQETGPARSQTQRPRRGRTLLVSQATPRRASG